MKDLRGVLKKIPKRVFGSRHMPDSIEVLGCIPSTPKKLGVEAPNTLIKWV
jgi:hypothetical protein